MKRFISAARAVAAVAAVVGLVAVSGDAKADNDRDHDRDHPMGTMLQLSLGGTQVEGRLARAEVATRRVAGTWQYRINLVGATTGDRSNPARALTCSIAVATAAEADRLRRDALDNRTLAIACTSTPPHGTIDRSAVLIDLNMISPAEGDALIITSRA